MKTNTNTILLLALIAAFAAKPRAFAEPGRPQPLSSGAVPEGLSASDWAGIRQQAYLKASNTGAGDQFAHAVAVSGDTVVVGAQYENSNATGVNGNQSTNSAPDSGAAYVFVRSGPTWVQQAYLKASNAGAGDRFGYAVAVSGDTIVVGAVLEASNATGVNGNQSNNNEIDSGAAYVFVRDGTNWSQQAYLKASNTGVSDLFGDSLAVSGDTVVVGAFQEASNATGVNGNQSDNSAFGSGAVYVFVRNGTNWVQQAYLKASNTGAGDAFFKVAVSGDTVVVGAPWEDSNATGVNGDQNNTNAIDSGAAYVFVRSGTNWNQQAYLKASNTRAGDHFFYVAVSGDTIAVGAHREDSNATGVNGDQNSTNAIDSGAAYIFVRNGTNWTQQAYLKASNTGADDRFGWAVSVSDDTAVVGAHFEDSNATGVNGDQTNNLALNSGAAYVFVRSGTNWTQQAYLKPSNTKAGDEFGGGPNMSPGTSVAVSGNTVVIGASFEDSGATGVNGSQTNNSAFNSGAAYIFMPPGPTITAQPTNQAVFTGSNATFIVTATTVNPPIRYQWRFNGEDLPGATNDSLAITNAQLANAGDYQVVLTDTVNPTGSTPATLSLLDAVLIGVQPQNQSVLRGASAVFSVLASSGSPLNYQWQFNATDLLGATNSTLTVTNVQAANVGNYTVIIANIYTSVTSAVATLELRIPPTITQQPQPITVVVCENATFTVTVTNTATLPINYQWRKGSIPLTNILLHSTTSSFTLYNVQTNVTTTNGPGGYRVAISNAATTGGIASSVVQLTVIPATAPSALTQAATNITAHGATLTGSVNPNGATTLAHFDYGLTASYGNSTPAVNLGNGTNSLAVAQVVTGLLPNMNYHFRLVASNCGGTNSGADLSFTTTGGLTAPTLVAPAWQGNEFSVSVATVSGSSYYLERKASLSDPDWTTMASVPGNDLVQILTDPAAAGAQGFYRVRVE